MSMQPVSTLHLFCGKAGAGKSTLASRLAKDRGCLLVCEDLWLTELYGDRLQTFDDYVRLSRRLKAVLGPLVVDVLRSGLCVVLDFPANTKSVRRGFRSLVEQAGVNHVLHFLDVPDAVCLERIAKRNLERPPGSHHLTEQDFLHVSSFFEAPEDIEGFDVVRYTA